MLGNDHRVGESGLLQPGFRRGWVPHGLGSPGPGSLSPGSPSPGSPPVWVPRAPSPKSRFPESGLTESRFPESGFPPIWFHPIKLPMVFVVFVPDLLSACLLVALCDRNETGTKMQTC